MDIEELRKRMEALNRAPLTEGQRAEIAAIRSRMRKTRPVPVAPAPASSAPVAPLPILYPRRPPQPAPKPAIDQSTIVRLQDAVPGDELVGADGGRAYLVTRRLIELDGQWDQLHEGFSSLLARGDCLIRRRFAAAPATPLAPEDLLFVDLETTGLGGSPLFLIGTMTWEACGLVVRQYLARDYSEEKAVIAAFAGIAVGKKVLVSFNGKSFDVPYLRLRASVNAVPLETPRPHLDMLHECRRIWRGKLPDCRLQTLERHVCGRRRFGDIPGSQIPDAYHAFVRTGNAAQIASIIDHNRLDLVTLADLMVRIPERADDKVGEDVKT